MLAVLRRCQLYNKNMSNVKLWFLLSICFFFLQKNPRKLWPLGEQYFSFLNYYVASKNKVIYVQTMGRKNKEEKTKIKQIIYTHKKCTSVSDKCLHVFFGLRLQY